MSIVDMWRVITSQELERLRNLVREMEYKLAEFGINPRRGIESYSLRELKRLVSKSPDRERFLELLKKLVELQESLYRELYLVAGTREADVDTDMPEKKLATIKEWLLLGKERESVRPVARKKKLSTVLERLADVLAGSNSDEDCSNEVTSLIKSSYKRDYDRYRVLRTALNACVEEGVIARESAERAGNSLKDAVSLLLLCRRVLGGRTLSLLIKMSGGVR